MSVLEFKRPLPKPPAPKKPIDGVIECGKCGSDVFNFLSLGMIHCVKCGVRVSNYSAVPHPSLDR